MWDKEGNNYVIPGLGDERYIIGKGNVKFPLDSANNVVADDGFPCKSEYSPLATSALVDNALDTDMEESSDKTITVSSNASGETEENESKNEDAMPLDDWVDISNGKKH